MTATYTLTVRYAETDAQKIVHHSNYLVWFEEGRSVLLRQAGTPYTDIEAAGYNVVVAGAELRYRTPARYADEVQIETVLVEARPRLLVFAYRALLCDGRLLAEGKTKHMILDAELKPVALPKAFLAPLQQAVQG